MQRSERSGQQGQPSGRRWTHSEAFLRMMEEVLKAASGRDGTRHVVGGRIERRTILASELAGVYVISVAARLAEMHPQTLRKYDREGLVQPSRTDGQRRLYSDDDVERLRIIRRLSEDFELNLNGVKLVLQLVPHIQRIVQLLESSNEVAGTKSARLAADELRRILRFVGADDWAEGSGQPPSR